MASRLPSSRCTVYDNFFWSAEIGAHKSVDEYFFSFCGRTCGGSASVFFVDDYFFLWSTEISVEQKYFLCEGGAQHAPPLGRPKFFFVVEM